MGWIVGQTCPKLSVEAAFLCSFLTWDIAGFEWAGFWRCRILRLSLSKSSLCILAVSQSLPCDGKAASVCADPLLCLVSCPVQSFEKHLPTSNVILSITNPCSALSSWWWKLWGQSVAGFSCVVGCERSDTCCCSELDVPYTKTVPKPPTVKTEAVCESAWLSNQTWAWQVEGWGCSWRMAETSYGISHSGLQPDHCGASQTWQLKLQAVRARREVKPVLGAAPEPPSDGSCFVPFSVGFLGDWLGSCVLACTFSPCSSRDHVPLINEC